MISNDATYEALRTAEDRAVQLFDECVRRALILAGKSERTLSREVFDVAHEMFGIRRHWHKRIVRAGPNTLLPYAANPPDRTIEADDILFFDFGPVFDEWEADIGRTFVLGDDQRKHALASGVAEAWHSGADLFREHPDLTAADLYRHVEDHATARAWECGQVHAGHLIGRFPHERIEDDERTAYIRPDNPRRLRDLESGGQPLHWVLEVHFVNRAAGFGAFYEGILPRL